MNISLIVAYYTEELYVGTFIPFLIWDKFYNLLKPIEWICTHCIFIVFWREYSFSTLGTLYALFCSGMGMDECIYKALQTLISSLIKPSARWVCSSKNSLEVLSKYGAFINYVDRILRILHLLLPLRWKFTK